MPLIVKIDGLDISEYVQASVDEFDPANAFNEPQFASNSITDGDLFVSMTRNNRQWPIPLLIVSDSNDNLAATVRTINSHLKQGVTLEYREDGASNSTYFDVESAVLDPDYRYQRNRQGVGKFLLKVWTRPLGHTGTSRVVATYLSTVTADLPVASMAIAGDALADVRLVASKVPVATRGAMIAWGFHPHPSFRSAFMAGDGLILGQGASYIADANSARATVIGGPLSATGPAGDNGIGLTFDGATYGIPSIMAGGHYRVLAAIRVAAYASGYAADSHSSPSTFPAIARLSIDTVGERSAPLGIGLKNQWRGQWQKIRGASAYSSDRYNLYDFGAVRLPEGEYTVNRHDVYIGFTGTNLATYLATQPFRTEGIFFLPLSEGAGVVQTPSRGNQLFGLDTGATATGDFQAAYDGGDEARPIARGEMPKIPAGATGIFTVFHSRVNDRPSTATANQMAMVVSAREQFQFFR